MPTKFDRVQGSFERAHADFEFPIVEFQNYGEQGITNGNVVGDYFKIGEVDAEFVPPREDASVDTEGTHLDFDTSIRVLTPDIDSFLADQTVADGETLTIAAGETQAFGTLTIETGGTVVVDGELVANEIIEDGTLTVNGTATVVDNLDAEIYPYGTDNTRPTKVIAENVGYEVQATIPETGSNMTRIRLIED